MQDTINSLFNYCLGFITFHGEIYTLLPTNSISGSSETRMTVKYRILISYRG